MRISRVGVAWLAAFAVCLTTGVSAAFAAPKVKVIAKGLNSPKHLLYTSRGLYVVESGSGGPEGPGCVTAPSTAGAGTTEYCAGLTASVALIHGGRTTLAAANLPSVTEGKEGTAAGPSAVTVSKSGRLSILYQDALVNPNGSNSLPAPASSVAGTFQISPGVSANIAAFDAQHPQATATLGGTPGETAYDSDPYDVIPYRGGYVVADAAANALLRVSRKGKISMLAHFPTQAEMVPAGVLGPTALTVDAQAVPTAVAIGRDGALYVGLLRGVPSEPGSSEIYRVVPGHAPKVWAKGLTAVTAIAFDRKGRLLATELSTGGLLAAPKVPGALVRVSANGRKVTVLAVSGLTEPTGVAVAPSGVVYVANHGTSAASATPSGEVLEISGLG